MEKNEEILQKLRDFRKEKEIEFKNENIDYEVDIEDVIYCGQLEFDVNGEKENKDVFLVVKNIDGNFKMEYYIDNDLIAIDYSEMIIPTEDYQKVDFKPLIKNEDKRISLNDLEIERMSNIAKSLGIEEKQIKASTEIDANNLKEEEILKKYTNIKSEFNPNYKVTASESFANLVDGTGKFSKVAIVYSNNSNDRFKMVGITSDGKVEEIPGLVQTEGTNPTENIISTDRRGDNVNSETVQALYKIKGRPNEGFAMSIGSAGTIDIDYVRRSSEDDYISIPIESTHTRMVDSDLRHNIDKTKNTYVEEEIDRAENELENHGNTNWKNIDDNPNNDIDHENVIVLEDGKEVTFASEAEKAKVSVEEFKRIYESQSKSLSPKQRLEATHEEIEEQYIGKSYR